MKLDLMTIKKGEQDSLDLNFLLNLDNISYYGDELKMKSPVQVVGKIYSIDERLYLHCDIVVEMEVNCSRCLQPFIYNFKSSINAELVRDELSDDLGEEDDVIVYTDNEIDLGLMVEENILTSLPFKFLCSTSCKGLCTYCGKDLNENQCGCHDDDSEEQDDFDPRLAKLKELFHQD